jgi:hypothetical protein
VNWHGRIINATCAGQSIKIENVICTISVDKITWVLGNIQGGFLKESGIA